MTSYAKRIRDLSPPAGVLAEYDRASVAHGFRKGRDRAAEIAAQADAEIRSMRIVAARFRGELDTRGAEIERMRAELAIVRAQSGEGAIGKFFDWISDRRTPAYMALFWFVFLGGTIAAVSSAVVSPSAFPTIAIVAIAAGGVLAVAYRRHIKATKGGANDQT